MSASGAKTKRRTSRKARRPAPAGNAARRKRQMARRVERAKGWLGRAVRGKQSTLPSWKELAAGNERSPTRRPLGTLVGEVSTLHFGLLLLILAGGVTFYVGHVHATQDLVAEVQRVRRENLRLHLKLNRLRGEFDRATGPAVVYERARMLGLEEGITYGPTISVAHGD